MKKISFLIFLVLIGCSTSNELSGMNIDATVDINSEKDIDNNLANSSALMLEIKPTPFSSPTPIASPTPIPPPTSTPIPTPIPTPVPTPIGYGKFPNYTAEELVDRNAMIMLIENRVSSWGAYDKVPDYPFNKSTWNYWTTDNSCIDTRNRVLIEESIGEIVMAGDCKVLSGEWRDPYTGKIINDPELLDIDHLVPMKNAHYMGAWYWDEETRENYANDMTFNNHLIAVSSSTSLSKGSKTPDEWKPPNEDFWCDYVEAWVTIKQSWGLNIVSREKEALIEMSRGCGPRLFINDRKDILYGADANDIKTKDNPDFNPPTPDPEMGLPPDHPDAPPMVPAPNFPGNPGPPPPTIQ